MKNLIMLAVFAAMSSVVYAQKITEQQAKERALQFLSDNSKSKTRSYTSKRNLLKATRTEVDNLYAFNIDDGGFVIVSSDERTIPVLGYSDTGKIDWQHMPENMRKWLENYGTAIAALGNKAFSRGEPTRSPHTAIAPLLTTQWDQYEPYWKYCPEYEAGKALTGCVATAMAQVMNYHRWPNEACEKIPAYKYPYNKDTLSLDELPPTTFDWELMKTDLTEVAKLMQYCGHAVQMAYGEGVSVTDAAYTADALRLYFNYDPNIYYANRTMYGIDEWEQLIYDELAASRPVIYAGRAGDGGHCFVCDGYDGNGLFHINWGWNGKSDGYFALSVLNPYNTSGSGASSVAMGYNVYQEAIIGVQPPTGKSTTADFSPKLILNGNIALDGSAIKLACHYDNMVTRKATFELAMGTISNDGTLTPLVKANKPYEIESREYDIDVTINLANGNLAAGTYHFVPMARCITTEGNWHLLTAPEKKVLTEVSDNGIICKLTYLPNIEIERAYVSNGIGNAIEPNEISLVINNKGNEYSGDLTLRTVLLDNQTAEEVIANLPSASDLGKGITTGGYLRAESTTEVPFNIVESAIGKYLLLLYESNSDVLLGYTTIALDSEYEYEFVDLEIVDYKLEFAADEDVLRYDIKIKNNDTKNNWPKYSSNSGEIIIVSFQALTDNVAGSQNDPISIAMNNEATINNSFDVFMCESDIKFTLEEALGNGQKKTLLETVIKPNETLTYPESSGIRTAVITDNQKSAVFDLHGHRLIKRPTKGLYIENGKVKF